MFPLVFGFPRSGTTLVRLMLDAHGGLAMSGETNLLGWAAQAQDRDTLRALLLGSDGWHNFALGESDLDEALAVRPFTVPAAVRQLWSTYAAKHGKPAAGDKTCAAWAVLPMARACWPDLRLVHVLRDPRDAIASVKGVPFAPTQDAEILAREWRMVVTAAGAAAGRLGVPYHEVQYEELVSDPEGVLVKLCGFLGLDYDPAMLDYPATAKARFAEMTRMRDAGGRLLDAAELAGLHPNIDQPPSTESVERYKRDLTQEEQEAVLREAGDALPVKGGE